jgi:uncharacterized membrane protein YgaE (UPF0421/DUF939 family)
MINKFFNEFGQGFMIGIGSAFSFGILFYIINDCHKQQLKELHQSYAEQLKLLNDKIYKLEQEYAISADSPIVNTIHDIGKTENTENKEQMK